MCHGTGRGSSLFFTLSERVLTKITHRVFGVTVCEDITLLVF